MHRYLYRREYNPFKDKVGGGEHLNSVSLFTPRLQETKISASLKDEYSQNQDDICKVIRPKSKFNLNNHISFHPESVKDPD